MEGRGGGERVGGLIGWLTGCIEKRRGCVTRVIGEYMSGQNKGGGPISVLVRKR